jgi:hypothetical protein
MINLTRITGIMPMSACRVVGVVPVILRTGDPPLR